MEEDEAEFVKKAMASAAPMTDDEFVNKVKSAMGLIVDCLELNKVQTNIGLLALNNMVVSIFVSHKVPFEEFKKFSEENLVKAQAVWDLP